MKQTADIAQSYPYFGVETTRDGILLTPSQFEAGTNLILEDAMLSTRYGFRELPLGFVDAQTEEHFRTQNIQGAKTHNPSKGQSGQVFAPNETHIMVSIAGKKYSIQLSGIGINSSANVSDVTNGLDQNSFAHLVYWESAEKYVLCNDGFRNLWIWDTDNPSFVSTGYLPTATPPAVNSQLPNGGTVIIYAHGRVCIVVNSRLIIVGDLIHSANQTNPHNILEANEQIYWGSGQYFLPPSSMGNILAGEILPLKDTAHGHGEIMFHCEDGGIFSLDNSIIPRSDWSQTVGMVKHAMLHTSARGPYAITLVDGDQIFRSQRSLESFVSASGESNLVGAPNQSIGESFQREFDKDFEAFLRFVSVVAWARKDRILTTVAPVVRGRYWFNWHIASMNSDPLGSEESQYAFEGLWTMPKPYSQVVQLIEGRFAGTERIFALARDYEFDPRDGYTRLVELDQDIRKDYYLDDDGVSQPIDIDCQVKMRRVNWGAPFSKKELGVGKIFWRNVVGEVKWGVWAKTDEVDWTFWQGGTMRSCQQECDENCFPCCSQQPYNAAIVLGELPRTLRQPRWVEFVVRWTGQASFEALVVKASSGKSMPDEWTLNPREVREFVNAQTPFGTQSPYRPLDYALNDSPVWHEELENQ